VYKVDPPSHSITLLGSFDKTTTGDLPQSNLALDSAGILYGTTPHGGVNGDGTIFKVSSTGGSPLTTLIPVNVDNGTAAGLTADPAGNLFGTLQNGGAFGAGSVFEIAAGTATMTTIYSFNSNGVYPNGGLILDSVGNIYGTTEFGGTSDDGTVFELPSLVPEPSASALPIAAAALVSARRRPRNGDR
jgi:uncharacterized repeat protein (TIGR03803 family)